MIDVREPWERDMLARAGHGQVLGERVVVGHTSHPGWIAHAPTADCPIWQVHHVGECAERAKR